MSYTAELQTQLAVFQPVLDGARQAMAVLRVDGTVLAVNRAALMMNAITGSGLVGEPFWNSPCWRGSPSTVELIKLDIHRAAQGEATRREVACGSTRSQRTVELAISPVLAPVASGNGGTAPELLIAEAHDVSVHRRLATMLEESVARHEAVLASALDPIITIDAYGTIQSASRTVERVLGWTPQELVGRNINILMPEPHHSAHDSYLANYRRTGRTNILGHGREFEAARKDGTLAPIELSVSRVDVPGQGQPLFTGIIKDMSERKRSDLEVSLLQSLTLTISESSSLPQALSASLRLIGEATGWDYGEVWLPSGVDSSGWYSAMVWVREGAGLQGMRVAPDVVLGSGESLPGLVFNSGRSTWIHGLADLPIERFRRREIALRLGIHGAAGIPIQADNRPIAIMLFFLRGEQKEDQRLLELISAAVSPLGNLIKRKLAEDELERNHQQLEHLVKERTTQLEQSHEQLRQADRLASIGTLAAGLGHDMNNVLLPVRCRLDAMDLPRIPEDLREQFHAVRRSVNYLQQLSDGLHLLSLDPEDLEASTETTDLIAWWDQVGTLLRKALPKSTIFEASIPEEVPPITVPPHRLTQAVLNLIVNAGEAIGEGGRVRFLVNPAGDGRSVQIAVKDDGRGMTEEVKRRALDPFFTTKKRGLGTGLGLSLVRGVVQGAGGSLRIESAPGQGTTITLEFPTPEVVELEEGQIPIAAISIHDARSATFVEAMFRAAGFEVARAEDDDPGEATIWALEPSEAALATAKKYLKIPGRKVMVFGEAPAAWRRLGAIVVNEPENFESIRRGVGEAIMSVNGVQK
jgi:PAS domain S-box-containing protein